MKHSLLWLCFSSFSPFAKLFCCVCVCVSKSTTSQSSFFIDVECVLNDHPQIEYVLLTVHLLHLIVKKGHFINICTSFSINTIKYGFQNIFEIESQQCLLKNYD